MFDFLNHYKKTGYLHHAYVIEGIYETIAPLLAEELSRQLGIEIKGNPDVFVDYYNSIGVDEAREIKGMQVRSAFGANRKIFIIGTDTFGYEAQNALLKTFEEPTDETIFFLIIPRVEMLLSTLRSRVQIVQGQIVNTEDEAKVLSEKFLDASLEGRFAIAKKMAEKKSGENINRELFRSVFDHIERMLYTKTAGKRDDKTANVLRELFQAKTYLANRGSSPKMLLEHIAMIM